MNVRIEPRWTFHRSAPRGGGIVTRSRAARCRRLPVRNGGKRNATACFSITTRTQRTALLVRLTRCVRLPDARVSAPLRWDEVPDCDPAEFTIFTVPKRFAEIGDPHAEMDSCPARSKSCWNSPPEMKPKDSGMRPGLRTFARWNPKGRGLRLPRAQVAGRRQPRIVQNAFDRGREFSRQGRGAGRA